MSALDNLKQAEANLGQSVSNAISQNAVTAAALAEALANAKASGDVVDDSGDLQSLADDMVSKAQALDAAFGKTSPAAAAIEADAAKPQPGSTPLDQAVAANPMPSTDTGADAAAAAVQAGVDPAVATAATAPGSNL